MDDDHILNEEEMGKQLSKNLVHNIFKDGDWGSFRHSILIPEDYVNNNVTDIQVNQFLSKRSDSISKVLFDPHTCYIVVGKCNWA